MKIGLDFHGVITDDPVFFAKETQELKRTGHEIHIITGHQDTDEFRKKVQSTGVEYTHFIRKEALFALLTVAEKEHREAPTQS